MSVRYNCFIKTEIDTPFVMDVSTSGNSVENPKESTGQVRTRKELSLKQKLEILRLYDQLPKMSQRSAANQLKISQPVLCKILKNRSLIENIIFTNENSVRKRTRGGKEREVESALKRWYVEVQKKNIPINGHIIREKAKELARQMGKDFAATDGWFTRWRKRENIVYNSLCRRKFKPENVDYFQDESKDDETWEDDPEKHEIFNDTEDNNYIEASEKYGSISGDSQIPMNIGLESKVNDTEDSKKWETMNENICQVFVKSEPSYEDEFQFEEKPSVNPPTDEEMCEALRILSAGVKHRTNKLQLHYEYEHFIYQLLKKVV